MARAGFAPGLPTGPPRDPGVPPRYWVLQQDGARDHRARWRGPDALPLHRETSQSFLDQATAEHFVYRKPKKGKGRGKWTWELKSEGRPNHYGDTVFSVYAIADMKNARTLLARDVLAARRSALKHPTPTAGVRMPDGRPFLATQRR